MSSNNAPRPKIGVGATVVQDLEVRGDVTIGSGTVVHPKVRIYADAGPIIIGQNNIIEERTVIRNRYGGTQLFFDSLTTTPVAVNNTYPNNSLDEDDSSDLTLSAAADQSFVDLFPGPGRRTSHGSVHYPDLVVPDSTGFFPVKNRPRFPQVMDEFDNSFQLPEVRGGRMTSSPGGVDIIGDCELEQQTMVIGNNNIFEVGSYVESLQIGDYNVVEFKVVLSVAGLFWTARLIKRIVVKPTVNNSCWSRCRGRQLLCYWRQMFDRRQQNSCRQYCRVWCKVSTASTYLSTTEYAA